MASDRKECALGQTINVRNVKVENRIVIAPMCTWLADGGSFAVNDRHFVHYCALASGGPGILIYEATPVEARGCISPDDIGLWNDAQEAGFKRMNRWIHENTMTKTFLQVGHAGRKALMTSFSHANPAVPLDSSHPLWTPKISASALPFNEAYGTPREMSVSEILDIKKKFISTCKRAIRAGCDGIEIHNAHGYLLNQFTSPVSNQRTDEYGGSREGRCKLSLDLASELREELGDLVPIFYRISAVDWVPNGFSVEDAAWFAKELRKRGIDGIHVSSGGVTPEQQILMHCHYQTDLAHYIKKELDAEASDTKMYVVAVGGITEPSAADELVSQNKCDFVAVARSALKNPYWARQALESLGASSFIPPYQRAAYYSVRKVREQMKQAAREQGLLREDNVESPLAMKSSSHGEQSPGQETTASIEA